METENKGYMDFEERRLEHFQPESSAIGISDMNNDLLPDILILPNTHNGVYMLENE